LPLVGYPRRQVFLSPKVDKPHIFADDNVSGYSRIAFLHVGCGFRQLRHFAAAGKY